MDSKNTKYVGRDFHELSEKEMIEIVGGMDASTKGTPGTIVSVLTKLTYAYCVSAVSGLLTYSVC